jgi:hypothetical protein
MSGSLCCSKFPSLFQVSIIGQRLVCKRERLTITHMFKWLNFQGVAHSDGYEVQVVDRGTIRYSEGERKLLIPVDMGPPIGVYFDVSARWQSPYDQEILTTNDCQRIRDRLIAATTVFDAPCVFL